MAVPWFFYSQELSTVLRNAFFLPLIAIACCVAAADADETPKLTPKVTLGSTTNRTLGPYWTALSRDGKELAYRTGVNTIGIFDPESGKPLRSLVIDEKEVGERLFFAPDSKHLILQSMQQFRLIDAVNGKVLNTIGGGNKFDIYSHEFHWSDDCRVLTDVQQKYDFGFRPKVQVWDAAVKKVSGEIEVALNGGNRVEAISGNGQLIATGGRFHRKEKEGDEAAEEYVDLWDAKTLKRTGRFHLGPMSYSVMLGLNRDGKYLITVAENQDGAVLWDTAKAKVATLGRFPGGYGRITFSPDNKLFAIQSIVGYTGVFETATGKKIVELQDAGRVPAGVGFKSNGDILACFVDQTNIRVRAVNKPDAPPPSEPQGHRQPVIFTRFSDDGSKLLTVGRDGAVLRWDVATGKLLETIVKSPDNFANWYDLAVANSNGKLLVVGSSGTLTLYNLEQQSKADLRTQSKKYYTRFNRIHFSQDGKRIFATGEGQENTPDFRIVIVGYAAGWNSADGKLISEVNGGKREDGEALLAKHFADEKFEATMAPSSAVEVEVGPTIRDPWASPFNAGPLPVGNQVTLRDKKTKKVLCDQTMNVHAAVGISFSPDGKKLAVPMNDNTVSIFELP
jgi:WD40 repeat protein